MGPVRRRLITAAALLGPAPAWADACTTVRPGWDGAEVTALGELLVMFQTPLVLILVLASALAVRLRHELGGVAVVVGWSIATYMVTGWGNSDGLRQAAMAEGCVGSPALFITVAVAIGIGVVLYTAPKARRSE